jgi:uncharacterized protein (DUF1800 family)
MAIETFVGQLGAKNAAHLLRRATFGPTPQDITSFSSMDVSTALDTVFQSLPAPQPPVDPATGLTWLNPAAGGSNSSQEDLIDYFMAWHLEQMRKSGNSIKERIVWFLHTHLPVRRSVVPQSEHLYYQNELFRNYAFGSFKTLFKKVILDNAMMLFIDNATNDVASPNENFAREMFELYSIGRGPQISEGNYTHYTEDDIKAATRILTGYGLDESFATLDPDTGLPTAALKTVLSGATEIANRHDPDPKQFSAAFQNTVIEPAELVDGYATRAAAEGELDAMLNMIFSQEETAKFLVRKIYRFFVYYDIAPEVESQIIVPLANTFRTSNYNLETVIRELLGSTHFYDTDNLLSEDNNSGALIKSPLEITLGTCRMFGIKFPVNETTVYQNVYQGEGILGILENQGLPFYEPYDVAGFEAYYQFPNFNRNWITPYSMAYRYTLSSQILSGTNAGGGNLGIQFDFLDWFENSGYITQPDDAVAMVTELTSLLYPFPVSDERRTYFIEEVLLSGLYPATYWTSRWNIYLSDPAGNEAEIRGMLDGLFHGLIQTPEYQLF